MHTPRIHTQQNLAPGALIELEEEPAHHIARVLRLRAGDAVCLFDGRGVECEGRIVTLGRKTVSVAIDTCAEIDRESPLRVTLAQGVSRGERMDYTLQKAVELGVAAIAPMLTRRTTVRLDEERTGKRHAHWQRVIIGACEQCGRNRIPELLPVMTLHEWLARPRTDLRLVLRGGAATSLPSLSPASLAVTLLIGPEGGLSEEEVAAAESAGYTPVRIGPRILRTETAALAALGALQSLWGDFR